MHLVYQMLCVQYVCLHVVLHVSSHVCACLCICIYRYLLIGMCALIAAAQVYNIHPHAHCC